MISAEHLTKRFGAFTAIEDVSFSVARGEIVGFLGPNGAGKSTTMRILAGVFPPTSGRAVVADHDVVADPMRARSIVGYFPERVSLYTDMTVSAYLGYVAEMKGLGRDALQREVGRAVEACALEHVAARLIGSLSKGFRQRVGIAQALVGSPRVLILDEPTAGLDPEQVADVRNLIRDLRGERTVILSTHVLTEVEATCQRVIIIHRGRIVAVDTPANLNRSLRHSSQVYIEVKGPPAGVLEALTRVAGVIAVDPQPHRDLDVVALKVTTREGSDPRETIAALVAERGWGLRELRLVALTLEEIFLSLVAPRETAADENRDESVRDLQA
jgi:ABC-2 type transport system ATP-binding protein